ncbi:glycosyltransferase, group 1 family protein [delta proteobacterium NaphS2]|nr:glycosyltransferase, group 1 family protein [delta proteobacterium NaphS2]
MHDSTTIRVAILGSFPPLRGVSSYCLELASALAKVVRINFLSFKRIYPGFLYPGGGLMEDKSFPTNAREGITVHRRLTWYNPISWLKAGLFTRADLLHAQWWSMPLAPVYWVVCAAFKIRKRPVIFTVHNVSGHDGAAMYGLISRLLFSLGNHFIVHTELNRKQLVDTYGIPPNLVSVIPHGSLDFQVNSAADRDGLRKELGIGPENKVLLIFGAIRPYKGLDIGIRAFADVAGDMPEARLLIVGKTWQAWNQYQHLIRFLGIEDKVILRLGYVPAAKVHRYFMAADLVILPYLRFDSQSGVGATAVAFRKPMIVTAVGGLPELVAHKKAVVPPNDPEALARAIKRVLRDQTLLDQMRISLDAVAEGLNWDRIAQSTCLVYDSALHTPRQASFQRGI